MKKFLFLVVSHVLVGALGFAIGIYTLPILIAPPPPSEEEVSTYSSQALYTGEFQRDLEGSDLLHWGEGSVSVGLQGIVSVPESVDPESYNTVIVWCEAFAQFITAARYR